MAAFEAIKKNAEHLAVRIAEKKARRQIFSLLPKKGKLSRAGRRNVELGFQKIVEAETIQVQSLIQQSDFVGVLKRYPIRASSAIDAITNALGFKSRVQYEDSVRMLLADNADAVSCVRKLLGNPPTELFA